MFDNYIQAASNKYGVEIPLIKAIISVESNWNPIAYRSEPQINDASIGLTQVLLKTAQWITNNPNLSAFDLYNPSANIDIGTKYLAWQLKRYNGDETNAVAAYNAGTAKFKNNKYVNYQYVDKVWVKYLQYLQEYLDSLPINYTQYGEPIGPVYVPPTITSSVNENIVSSPPSEIINQPDTIDYEDKNNINDSTIYIGAIILLGFIGYGAYRR